MGGHVEHPADDAEALVQKPLDNRSDMYSLGATLYHAVAVGADPDRIAETAFDTGELHGVHEVAPRVEPLAGTALKYLHTDSWEVEVANWTPTLREEFRQRRGYDLLPFLPVIAGRIVAWRAANGPFRAVEELGEGKVDFPRFFRRLKELGYTAPIIIRAMYAALQRFGFERGRLLEPACGLGHFIGLMPESMHMIMWARKAACSAFFGPHATTSEWSPCRRSNS